MKIVQVLDLYDQPTNGVATATKRNVTALREMGHEVTIVSTGDVAEDKVQVDEFGLPLFQNLVNEQGFVFAKPDDKKFFEAFCGADLIHFHLPSPLCIKGEKIARQMNIPTVASFHVQPQNITYTLGLGRRQWANDRLYQHFYKLFYSKFNYIHAPSKMIAEQLRNHHYTAEIRVISNGVSEVFHPQKLAEDPAYKDKFKILMVGRLSREKRQDLLIEAVKKSKYEAGIQVIFAGQGPERKHLEFLSAGLSNPPSFGFHPQDELVALMNQADLYVHASDAEIEGISCLEAMACGLVPVISDSKLSASNSFALCRQSLFTAGDAADLAAKIDYWIEHPEERALFSEKYASEADSLRVHDTVKELLKLYEDVIRKHKADGYPKPGVDQKIKLPHKGRLLRNGKSIKFLRNAFMRFLAPFLYLYLFLFYGVKVYGRGNSRKLTGKGAVSIMNHIHNMDSCMAYIALFPAAVSFTSMPANFSSPLIGRILKFFGVIPTPTDFSSAKNFSQTVEAKLAEGNIVHFYPESLLIKDYEGLRDFQNGSFHLAVKGNKAILPMAIRKLEPRKGKPRLLTGRSRYIITIGEPLYANIALSRKAAVSDLKKRAHQSVRELLDKEISTPDYFLAYDLARIVVFAALVRRILQIAF